MLFALDANVFLQCKPLEELAWVEITSAPDVDLVVPAIVQKEIDRLKQDGSARRSQRARLANSLFRKILEAKEALVVVREAKPRVTLRLLQHVPLDSAPPDLDRDYGDDRLVAEAMIAKATVLTGDAGPAASSRRFGHPFVFVPSGWLLPQEPDKESKEVQDLRRRIERIERSGPRLQLQTFGPDGRILSGAAAFHVLVYEGSKAAIEWGVEQLGDRFPMRANFEAEAAPPKGIAPIQGREWSPPSNQAISNYRERQYPDWLAFARGQLEAAVLRRISAASSQTIRIVLTNEGERPAEGALLDVESQGELMLETEPDSSDDAREAEGDSKSLFDPPPQAPRGRFRGLGGLGGIDFDSFAKIRSMPVELAIHPRFPMPSDNDPNAFYWVGGRPAEAVPSIRLRCSEFPHRLEAETFGIVVSFQGALPGRKVVRVRASAANLAEPVEVYIPFEVTLEKRDAREVVAELVVAWPERL